MGIPMSQRSALADLFLKISQKVMSGWVISQKVVSQKVGAKILCVGQIRRINKKLFIRTALYSVSGSPNDHSTKLSSQILI